MNQIQRETIKRIKSAAERKRVWCHSLHDLQKRSQFTDWSKYTQDEVIK